MPDLSRAVWRTSTHSNNGGECVEVADNLIDEHGVVLLRDSKDRDGPVITFRTGQFAAFLHEAVGDLNSTNGAVEVIRHDLTVRVAGRRIQTTWHIRSLATNVTLHFTAAEWVAFRTGAEHGEFGTTKGHERGAAGGSSPPCSARPDRPSASGSASRRYRPNAEHLSSGRAAGR